MPTIESRSGLRWLANANGSLRRIDYGDVTVNLFVGSEVEGGVSNLYLRVLRDDGVRWAPLLGPGAKGTVSVASGRIVAAGEWEGLRYRAVLRLADDSPTWIWRLVIDNRSSRAARVDLMFVQDVALAHYAALRNNEYYMSQYVDVTALDHPERGVVLGVRQNLPMGGRNPWLLLGSFARATSYATDALQFYGLETRAGREPVALASERLPGVRLQHEQSVAVLQDYAFALAPGERAVRGFFGHVVADHPAATSAADLELVDAIEKLPESRMGADDSSGDELAARPVASLFSSRPLLAARDLDDAEIECCFGAQRRHEERIDGTLLSFFAGDQRHVVLKAKELRSLRQHGHILRTGDELAPEEAAMSSTAWMNGTFNSLLTQGHCNINRFLSTARGYLGFFRAHGQRVFVELDGGYQLLDVPSAFEMTPSGCRWIYRHAGGRIDVSCFAPVDRHEIDLAIRVVEGEPRRFLVTHHVALAGDDLAPHRPALFEADEGGVTVRPPADSDIGRRFPAGRFRIDVAGQAVLETVANDGALFLDGRSRDEPYVALRFAPTRSVVLRIRGELVAPAASRGTGRQAADAAGDAEVAERFWRGLTAATVIRVPGGAAPGAAAERLGELLPWLAHNALIHYLAPHGLEQYSNGGWGSRDVSQGPVELFLSLERYAEVRDLLLRLFSAQNPDGDWPQWFMFFDRERDIRAPDSHGDIVFWPVVALAQYVLASRDSTIWDEVLPYHAPANASGPENAPLIEHVQRALRLISRRVIPGTRLAAYGHGDWNDSLQPADPSMAESLCSAWTVTLHCQTLVTLACALRETGRDSEPGGLDANALDSDAAAIRADFQRILLADGVLTGFAYFRDDGRIDRFLHPSDDATGVRFRLLPMIHAIINDLLTPDQARAHVEIIRKHLLGSDGARLFDRPTPYRGGPERHFRRAESAAFFGREIGVMYTHAHLRYAEAMAHYGDADAFFLALRQANPILLQEAVPSAAIRQSNCYHSSSDAAFPDRYVAGARYDEVRTGRVRFEGGWRVYSSGAGIASRLVRQCLLGLRASRTSLVLDPVVPQALDGMEVETELLGAKFRIVYRVAARGCGPVRVTLNGDELPFVTERNPYRRGGARLDAELVRSRLVATNDLLIEIE